MTDALVGDRRVRDLVHKLFASPTFPALGWTKVVETIVANGPTFRWVVYAIAITLLWIVADELRARAEAITDNVTDAVEDATD